MAISDLFNKLNNIFSDFLVELIIALIILLVGIIIGKIVGKLVQRGLHEVELNNILKSTSKIRINLEEFIAAFVTYLIYFITVVVALRQIGLATLILDIVAAIIIVIIVLAVFLGIKDFIPNTIAGIFLHQKRMLKEGDVIKVTGIEGKVIYMDLVETKVETKDGDIIHVPNSILIKEKMVIKKRKKE